MGLLDAAPGDQADYLTSWLAAWGLVWRRTVLHYRVDVPKRESEILLSLILRKHIRRPAAVFKCQLAQLVRRVFT